MDIQPHVANSCHVIRISSSLSIKASSSAISWTSKSVSFCVNKSASADVSELQLARLEYESLLWKVMYFSLVRPQTTGDSNLRMKRLPGEQPSEQDGSII